MEYRPFQIIFLIFLSLSLMGCPDPEDTVTVYERIVIDTYSPTGALTADTYIDLFDAKGDPDADDPWIDDDTGDAVAFDDDGNPDWPGSYARIDYTSGLVSGTYFIRVRGAAETVDDYYVTRVLSLKSGDSLPAYDFPNVLAGKPDGYEDDDFPQSGGIPLNPVSIQLGNENWVNRSIDDPTPGDADGNGDVDWFKLVLP